VRRGTQIEGNRNPQLELGVRACVRACVRCMESRLFTTSIKNIWTTCAVGNLQVDYYYHHHYYYYYYYTTTTTTSTTTTTPWSRALREKLTGPQLVNKYTAFYGTHRFITAFTTARPIQSMPTPPPPQSPYEQTTCTKCKSI
jgi:hypothetical protein